MTTLQSQQPPLSDPYLLLTCAWHLEQKALMEEDISGSGGEWHALLSQPLPSSWRAGPSR